MERPSDRKRVVLQIGNVESAASFKWRTPDYGGLGGRRVCHLIRRGGATLMTHVAMDFGVTIVVVTHRSGASIGRCLGAPRRHACRHSVLVADNADTDTGTIMHGV